MTDNLRNVSAKGRLINRGEVMQSRLPFDNSERRYRFASENDFPALRRAGGWGLQTKKEVTAMALMRRNQNAERGLARTQARSPFEMIQDLMQWDPFRELSRGLSSEVMGAVPVDVKETKDSYVFKADLPGVKESELDISLTGNRLTISGNKEEEKREEGDTFYAYERSYGSFSRSFTLPAGIDTEHVGGDLKDGVLTVVVPKKAEAQPKRIPLKGAKEGEKKAKA